MAATIDDVYNLLNTLFNGTGNMYLTSIRVIATGSPYDGLQLVGGTNKSGINCTGLNGAIFTGNDGMGIKCVGYHGVQAITNKTSYGCGIFAQGCDAEDGISAGISAYSGGTAPAIKISSASTGPGIDIQTYGRGASIIAHENALFMSTIGTSYPTVEIHGHTEAGGAEAILIQGGGLDSTGNRKYAIRVLGYKGIQVTATGAAESCYGVNISTNYDSSAAAIRVDGVGDGIKVVAGQCAASLETLGYGGSGQNRGAILVKGYGDTNAVLIDNSNADSTLSHAIEVRGGSGGVTEAVLIKAPSGSNSSAVKMASDGTASAFNIIGESGINISATNGNAIILNATGGESGLVINGGTEAAVKITGLNTPSGKEAVEITSGGTSSVPKHAITITGYKGVQITSTEEYSGLDIAGGSTGISITAPLKGISIETTGTTGNEIGIDVSASGAGVKVNALYNALQLNSTSDTGVAISTTADNGAAAMRIDATGGNAITIDSDQTGIYINSGTGVTDRGIDSKEINILNSMAQGRFRRNYPTNGDVTFYDVDGTSVLFVMHVVESERTRIS